MSAIAICLVSGLFYQGVQTVSDKSTLRSFQNKKMDCVLAKDSKLK